MKELAAGDPVDVDEVDPLHDSRERAAEVVHDEPAPPRRGVAQHIKGVFADARNWRDLRRTPYGLRPVFVLSAAIFFLELSGSVLGLAAPDIIQELDISLETIFRFSGFVGFLSIFAVLGIAYYADRRPRVPMFGVGIIVAGIVGAFQARARSALSLGVPNTGQDVALTVAGVPVDSLLADYYPPETRGKVFALLGLFGTLGGVFVPLAVSRLISMFGWRSTYVVLSAPVTLVGVYALVRLKEPTRGYFERLALGAREDEARTTDEPPSFGESARTIFGVRTLRRLFIANIFDSSAAKIYAIAQVAFFFQEYGLDVKQRGYLIAAFGVAALPGAYIGGGLTDALNKRRPSQVLTLFGVFSLISAAGTLVLPTAAPLWVIFISGAVITFGGALIGPATGALFVNITPAHVRTLGGAVRGMSSLPGVIFALPLAGIIISRYGLRSGLLIPFPLFVIGAIVKMSAAGLYEFDVRSAFAATVARNEWRKAQAEGHGKLLVCRDVDVAYSGVQVLFGVDFDVEEGEIIALLGTNGAGKSTLLRAISGTTPASSGAIVFDGRDISFMPPHETARRGIVFMPGGRGVFPGLSVRENLLLGSWMNEDTSSVAARMDEVFRIFPSLAARIDSAAGTLSGGEQQQLSLAQAFLCNPKLLMIDELSLGLSPAVVGELIEVVRRIHETGVTIIVVEQSVNVALTLAEKAIFMEKGEVKFFGATAELLARPDILRAVYVKGTGALTDGAPASAQRSARQQRQLELGSTPAVLEVKGITKRFGGITALDSVDLSLRDGEVLGLIGPNGSGKTTLFEIISGYQTPDAGMVTYEGIDITGLPPEERARRRLVRRFQDARLFPALTVFETLLVSLEQKNEVRNTLLNALSTPQARRSERRVRARAERLIELLELGSYRDKFVRELSTGLRRVVDLACVLATEPKVLLLDEPSSGIAQAEAEGLAPLLRRVRFETGCSILIVEHDMPMISAVADELVALERGTVLLRGTPEDVLNDDRVIESYLGGAEAAVKRSGSLI
jgi:ABC-type branched-subunit amino acid transport system ATPase component/sugar phosphate permease